jgi:hypothetical protein
MPFFGMLLSLFSFGVVMKVIMPAILIGTVIFLLSMKTGADSGSLLQQFSAIITGAVNEIHLYVEQIRNFFG